MVEFTALLKHSEDLAYSPDVITQLRNRIRPRHRVPPDDVPTHLRRKPQLKSSTRETRKIPGSQSRHHRTARKRDNHRRPDSESTAVLDGQGRHRKRITNGFGDVHRVETKVLDASDVLSYLPQRSVGR